MVGHSFRPTTTITPNLWRFVGYASHATTTGIGTTRQRGCSILRVLDLFSGIGGFSLGLEWAGGFKTVGFCEIEPFCQAVLRKHWPDVWIHDDIRTLTTQLVRRQCEAVDVIVGGFP
jgi:predicted RNA methylase